MIYDTVNEAVLNKVPSGALAILDVGCGAGALGRAIKQGLDCKVAGITISDKEAAIARQYLDEVHVRDLEMGELSGIGKFDCIVCSHVLEHLSYPERLLRSLQGCLVPAGSLIVALPNVLFWRQRWQFLRGAFTYTDGGIMDRTHLRFFDWASARQLIADGGYRILTAEAVGGFPKSRHLGNFGRILDRIALRFFPGFFGHQFVFVCSAE